MDPNPAAPDDPRNRPSSASNQNLSDSADADGLRRRQGDSVHSSETQQQRTDLGNADPSAPSMAPYQDYYMRLHQWIWTYQWYRFCWEQQQREWRDRYFWQQWSHHTHALPSTSASAAGPSWPGAAPQAAPRPPLPGPAIQVQRPQGNPLQIPLAAAGHPQIFVGAVGPDNQLDPSWKGFKMAPIWKRVVAECIDIFLLVLLKLILTYTIFDDLFFIDFKKYGDLLDPDVDVTADMALDLASELMLMEFCHRLISCLYEMIMTVHGFPHGGATYGKRFMGLRVVTCQEFILLDGMVLVKPADTPNWKQAAVRAFLKNYSWAVVVPLPLTALLNRERRTMYDTACKCMVVEAGDPMVAFLR
ncbi:protein FAM8A1-like [Paramacrobiotus metropolitanus]|uniref:protein FAM8A1-like n=1 Tax=Paramacrobiotus metropolitanus TaxID=2943436 RepID=UPI00244639F7|nr:protein FAM8A1-like [Paramacrobiotus metropolitanus]